MALRLAAPRANLLLRSTRSFTSLKSYTCLNRCRTSCSALFSTGTNSEPVQPEALEQLLAEPTWSVDALLPPKDGAPDAPKISSKQLHHLLRLSALPPPVSPEAEQKMLNTLSAQLHFVGEIQQVDTSGVIPLRAIRDETSAAEKEQMVSLETLKEALAQEHVVGKHYRRIQRKSDPVDAKDVESWDVLGSAERKVGKFFVVESELPQE